MGEKKLWWQAYLAALTGAYANGSITNDAVLAAAERAVKLMRSKFQEGPIAAASLEWVHLEVLGHREHYGYLRQVERFGVDLLEMACLGADGKVKEFKLYTPGAVFCVTKITEEEAKHKAAGDRLLTCEECGSTFWMIRSKWTTKCPNCGGKEPDPANTNTFDPAEPADDNEPPW